MTTSANPGDPATHRIPQTFDIRRSDPTAAGTGLANHPDELMVDWGNTPPGCVASIYWPGADAASILAAAARLYGTQVLSMADAHTIQMVTRKGVTYVPIPAGTGESLAGLLTVNLPPTVVKGQEYNIVLRRIGTRRVTIVPPPPPPPPSPPPIKIETRSKKAGKPKASAAVAMASAQVAVRPEVAPPVETSIERYVVGSFQVKIPVKAEAEMLPGEETTLAILKARLLAMPPASRWYPVLKRYIGLISARVDGLGGNASAVPPTFLPSPGLVEGPGGGEVECEEYTGKIDGLVFDHFGDFEGFILETAEGQHRFGGRDTEMRALAERMWRERLRVTVCAERDKPHRVRKVIVHAPPATFR